MGAVGTIAALTLALATIGSPHGAQANRRVEADPHALLVRELATLQGGERAWDVAQRLAAIGPRAAEAVLAALARTAVAAHDAELARQPEPLVLGAREREALLMSAHQIGRPAFATLWSEAAASSDASLRCAVIELVGVVGDGEDLRVALTAASPADGERADPRAVEALEEAALALVNRDSMNRSPFRAAILSAPPELATRLIRAVARGGDRRALDFLGDLLGFDARLDLPLLSQIAALARTLDSVEARQGERLYGYLANKDRQLARAAAVALGELGDVGALDLLLDASAASDRGLSGAAFRALEQVTAMKLPHRTERWRSWLASEREWKQLRYPQLTRDLTSSSAPRIAAALREFAAHPLEREHLAVLVTPFVDHEDTGVRLAACRTLQALGPAYARLALERATSDADPQVAAAASAALQICAAE